MGELHRIYLGPFRAPWLHRSEFAADPWGTLERIRRAGPVVYNEGPIARDLAPADGYMVSGFDDCKYVLGNFKQFRSMPEWFVNKFGGLVFEAFDDSPPHNEMRGVWSNQFRRGTLHDEYLGIVQSVIEENLVPFAERLRSGEVLDAQANLHAPIPLCVILQMMGLDTSNHEMLAKWAHELSGTELAEGTESLNKYLSGVVHERTHGDGADLISCMARASTSHDFLQENDVVANATQLVFAGAGTTTSLMSSCLLLLDEHRDQRQALMEDRSLIPQAIEEALRLRTVAQMAAPRLVAGGDAEIHGVRVPEGATVVCLLGAANRDPDWWSEPDKFDVKRPPLRHLGFGFGVHNCLGMNLARLECEVYLNQLFDLLPEWELAGDVDVHVDTFVAVDSVPLRLPTVS